MRGARLRRFVAVALVAAAAVSRLVAQEPAPLPVSATFEVTSVKRVTDPTVQIGARSISGGRLAAVFTVRTLVQLAYGYPDTLRTRSSLVVRHGSIRIGSRSTRRSTARLPSRPTARRCACWRWSARCSPIEFAREATADTQGLSPIMTAPKEQLGLELKPATGPVNVLVIDHVEPPTAD